MIKIEITGETPLDALAAITAFGLHSVGNDSVMSAANAILERETAKREPKTPNACEATPVVPPPAADPMVNPTTAPVSAPPVTGGPAANVPHVSPSSAPAGAPPVVPVAPPLSFTIDQIATAGAALVQAGKMADLMALLGQFGVQAVTELKPEQLGPFATALRGLGAAI